MEDRKSSVEAMEIITADKTFWNNKKVFITGHTGFKGSWLSLWLHVLGAKVTGYALNPPTDPSLFELCKINELVKSIIADIRDRDMLLKALLAFQPEIVIHMAAQPLVRDSYKIPVETYEINVMGTVHLLEAVRSCSSIKAVINVTTDKCYENRESNIGYKETDAMGGYDPYSNSKACSELVTSAYRSSYFNPKDYLIHHSIALASARAGNVIGGGDWATDRLIPDCMRAVLNEDKIVIRNPEAIRPWQYVMEPLNGYLLLAQKLYEEGVAYAEAWNFGSEDIDAKPVEWLVKKLCAKWGSSASYVIDNKKHPHEAHYLKLECSKSKQRLKWNPRWNLEKTIDSIVEWTRAYQEGKDMRKICLKQIEEYSVSKVKA